ncbi:MAG: SGNH/GDSL hydrolase family protein [Treponema sp.]|jgi:lysophospholipase L1-like esterase|nr:SGNH/GDSL hydrolase family protein [Treponema sp.]
MKNNNKWLGIIALAGILAMVAAACGGEDEKPLLEGTVTIIPFSGEILAGEELYAYADVNVNDPDYQWYKGAAPVSEKGPGMAAYTPQTGGTYKVIVSKTGYRGTVSEEVVVSDDEGGGPDEPYEPYKPDVSGGSGGGGDVKDAAGFYKRDYRTINALLKLKKGGSITFAGLGGSITQMGCVDGVSEWLKAKAAQTGGSVNFVNAGIGGSDSGVGLLRIQDHVLRHNPDILIIEFAVNDGFYYDRLPVSYNRIYEGLVRQALKSSDRAVQLLLLHKNVEGGAYPAQNSKTHAPQKEVGDHYALPVFIWLDYAGLTGAEWMQDNYIYTDGTHLTAAGNASVSKGITDYLEALWNKLPSNALTVNTGLPVAKHSTDYEKTAYIKWGDASVRPGGWTQYSTGMLSWLWGGLSSDPWKNISGFHTTGGNTNEVLIKFRGKSVYIISTFLETPYVGLPYGTYDGGRAWVEQADGAGNIPDPSKYVGSRSQLGPNWYFSNEIANGLNPVKEHTLHIRAPVSGSMNFWGAIVGE